MSISWLSLAVFVAMAAALNSGLKNLLIFKRDIGDKE